MRQQLPGVCLALVMGFMAGCSATGAEPPGLYVKNGTVMKDGKAYRGIGTNYSAAFTRVLYNSWDPANWKPDHSYREGFAALAKAGVPFVRFGIIGHQAKYYSLYQRDPEAYYKLLDGIVAEAEKQGIGIVMTMFWQYGAVPELVGEETVAWGDAQSKTRAFMRKRVAEIVPRYKNSPAIWAWEFGNEYNLYPKQIPPYVQMAACSAFAREVRKYDDHRMVASGNALQLPYAASRARGRGKGNDTEAEFKMVLQVENPDPLDVICSHIYLKRVGRGDFWEGRKADWGMVVEASVKAAKDCGKPFFLEEFGVPKDHGTPQEVKRLFMDMLGHIEKNNVPLAAIWNFDVRDMPDPRWQVLPGNDRWYMIEEIVKLNAKRSKAAGP
jgi:hypothetical protein